MFSPLHNLAWQDVLDVLFLTVVAYYLYLWFKGTKALRALIGLVALGAFYSLARFWGLFLTTWVFQILWQVVVILFLILFQNEIRQVLERVSPLKAFGRRITSETRATLSVIAAVARQAAQRGWGALLILKRQEPLSELAGKGLVVEARATPELLISIFNPSSPAHDGAVVLDGEEVVSMGVVLPLSSREDLPRTYGTRHRAALGISEVCDAVAVVVSEENGQISLAADGQIRTLSGPDKLETELFDLMGAPGKNDKSILTRLREAVFNHWPIKIGALLLISMTWLVLAGQQNYQVSCKVPVDYISVRRGLEVAELSDREVNVKLVGPRRRASAVRPEDITVIVNLAGKAAGDHQIALLRQNLYIPLGLEVAGVSPKTLNVTLKPGDGQ
ncbi:MAG: DNA integrity scanning protein DisA nucleotide-binding domain protein [Deltaproteobacteria bacterium]|nr:DNA integrity scanning protein DisA nucleotide-binding domain protein [Deltaproteobacteria bacterium]